MILMYNVKLVQLPRHMNLSNASSTRACLWIIATWRNCDLQVTTSSLSPNDRILIQASALTSALALCWAISWTGLAIGKSFREFGYLYVSCLCSSLLEAHIAHQSRYLAAQVPLSQPISVFESPVSWLRYIFSFYPRPQLCDIRL